MLSRRSFLTTTAGAGLALAANQQAAAQAPAAQPARPSMIVDAQVHLWKAEAPDRPWLAGRKPQLPEPFTIEKLVPLMDEAGVERVVIVPPSWEGNRNDYGLEAAKRYPGRFAVMGRLPLEDPKSAALLPKWREQPGMLGVRVTFQGAWAKWLSDGSIEWFWDGCEKAGLPVMFLGTGDMTPFGKIAERYPQLGLVIDHMGLSGEVVDKGMVPQAIAQSASLAKYPNMSCKVSSAGAYSTQPYPWPDMTDHIKRLFDAFGPQRCHWGTDMTNSLAKATYKQRIEHFTKELKFMSAVDLDWVMGRSILQKLKWA